MKEYKRITIRDEFGNADIIGVDSELLYQQLTFNESNALTKAFNKLAFYEDKIENGTLIELPCKVGDIVYIVSGKIFEHVVLGVMYDHKGIYSITTVKNEKDAKCTWSYQRCQGGSWDLSKVAFTKAEAEQCLKDLKVVKNEKR